MTAEPIPTATPEHEALCSLRTTAGEVLAELAAVLAEPGLTRWQRAARLTEAAGPVTDALAVLIETVARDPYPVERAQRGEPDVA